MKLTTLLAFVVIGLSSVSAAELRPGALDPNFLPNTNSGVYTEYTPLALQADGRILVWQGSTTYQTTRADLSRLNRDGGVDASFGAYVEYTEFFPVEIKAAAVQTDGKILIMGRFSQVNGTPMPGVARLNNDGTLDSSFKPRNEAPTDLGIQAMALQRDGRICLGGFFSHATKVLRLLPDGAVDPQFQVQFSHMGRSNQLISLLLQPDGKILISGIDWLIGEDRNPAAWPNWPSGNLQRLNPDGTLDEGFAWEGVGKWVKDFDLQSDGSIVAVFSQAALILARYSPSGAFDTSFGSIRAAYPPTDPALQSVKVDPADRILVCGSFPNLAGFGETRANFARLLKDGDLDLSFDAGPRVQYASSILLQPDGKVLVSGSYAGLDGAFVNSGIARFIGGDMTHSPPAILTSPESLTVGVDNNALFSPETSRYPLAYQWFKDGTAQLGATNRLLYLEGITPADEGLYSLHASNEMGVVTSAEARLSVTPSSAAPNLVLNPSFEQAYPHFFFSAAGWAPRNNRNLYRPNYPKIFGPPITRQAPFPDYPYPAQGSNFVGIYTGRWEESPARYVGLDLVGTLAPATQPGHAYRVSGWFRRNPDQTLSEEKVALSLEDAQGHSLAVGTVRVQDTHAWTPFSASVILSREYDHIVLRGNNDPGQRSTSAMVWLDQIGLFAIAKPPLMLEALPNALIAPDDLWVITNRVTGVDVLDISLRYSLEPGAPDGMSIDPRTGILAWTAMPSQALGSWNVTVRVRADLNPDLTTTTAFTVETGEAVVVKLACPVVAPGDTALIPVQFTPFLKTRNSVSQLEFILVERGGHLTRWEIETVSSQVKSAALTALGDNQIRVTLTAVPGQGFSSAETLACLRAAVGSGAGVVPLEIAQGKALTADGLTLPLFLTHPEPVFIVGTEPFLWAKTQAGRNRALQVFGPAGTRVSVGSSTLKPPVTWQLFKDITLSNLVETIGDIPEEPPTLFFRLMP